MLAFEPCNRTNARDMVNHPWLDGTKPTRPFPYVISDLLISPLCTDVVVAVPRIWMNTTKSVHPMSLSANPSRHCPCMVLVGLNYDPFECMVYLVRIQRGAPNNCLSIANHIISINNIPGYSACMRPALIHFSALIIHDRHLLVVLSFE
jgi:hypothetical protein